MTEVNAGGILIGVFLAAVLNAYAAFGAGEGAAEAPAVLREALLWLDARDEATLSKDAAGRVAAWRSKDARGVLAEWAGAKPVWSASAWGVPAVDFGAHGSGRDLRYPRVTNLRTVFEVVWLSGERSNVLLGDVAGGKGANHFHRGYGLHGALAGAYTDPVWGNLAKAWNSFSAVKNLCRQRVPDDDFQVLCLEMKSASASDSLTNDRDLEGRNGGRRLAELIAFDRVLTAAEREGVTAYLVRKWLAAKPPRVTDWPDAGGASEDARALWDALARDIAHWKKLPASVAREAEHPAACILPGDRDPVDVLVRRTRALLADLAAAGVDLAAEARELDELARAAESFWDDWRTDRYPSPIPFTWDEKRFPSFSLLLALNRRIALKNPLLKTVARLVFVGHEALPYPHNAGSHMCDQYYGFHGNLRGAARGDALYVLEHPFAEHPVARDLLAGRLVEAGDWKGRTLGKGAYLSPDVSWDGRRIAFAYSRAVPDTYEWHDDTVYHVFTCAADGSQLRQLTTGAWNEFDPCWLPNGRLAFISERRGGFVRCSGDRPVPCFTLYSMFPNGSDIVQLSAHETNEWHPSVDNDGMILYTRWDYVDRGHSQAHHLWRTTPDGRDPRAVNGNERDKVKKTPFLQATARAIPGSRRYVAVAGPHHGTAFGSLILVDPAREDDGDMNQIRRVTPEQPFPESEFPPNSHWAHRYTGSFATPWPLSEKYFLCVWDARANGAYASPAIRRYSLALVDVFGNRTRLYTHPTISCLDPMPLQARPTPPRLAHGSLVGLPVNPDGTYPAPVSTADLPKTALVGVVNVNTTRYPFPSNTVITALRVWQALPKTTPLMNRPRLGADGLQMGRQCLGTVSVEADGSVSFEAPVNVPFYLQALDREGRAVQTMRSDTYVHPGEKLMCAGCHEPQTASAKANPAATPLALKAPPQAIRPAPEGANPFNFARLVQPVLDAKCVRCHGEKRAPKAPDLRAGDWRKNAFGFSTAYLSLVPYVKWVTRGAMRSGRLPGGGSYYFPTASEPGRLGALASPLDAMLRKGHHGVALTPDEWERLVIFMDSNGQFIGHNASPEAQRDGKTVCAPLE